MKRYLVTILAAGLLSGAAYAGDEHAPLQLASLGKGDVIPGLKSDLYDKKALHNAVADSLRLLTWDDREIKSILEAKKAGKNPAKLGDKD